MLKNLLLVLALTLFTGSLVACNTFKGVGKDVESAGEAMQGDDAE